MNEQELADLFSAQVDRMLDGQPPDTTANIDDLTDLLSLSDQLAQTRFQAGAAAQTAFLNRLADWFGHAINGDSPMALFGLSKTWFISIISVVIIAAGVGIIALVSVNISASATTVQLPDTATPTPTDEEEALPEAEETPTATPELTATPVMTTTPVTTDTESTGPLLVFIGDLDLPSVCGGVYSTQQVLVNYSNQPIDQAALVWEVIEGADLVDDITIGSPDLLEDETEAEAEAVDVNVSNTTDPLSNTLGYANLDSIAVNRKVKLDVKIKVKDKWWTNEGETKIKVKLSVSKHVKVKAEFGDDDISGNSQVITIVRRDAEWVTLRGFLHPYHDQTYLVDGNVVVIGDCTALPEDLFPGAFVEIIGLLQPDGTFIAININVDVNIIVINNFNSGVPEPSDDGGDNGGGNNGKGGSKCTGSKCGGSKG